MLLMMTGEQLGVDEDDFFCSEFEVFICDDHLEDDVIKIEYALDNDCDMSHMIDDAVAEYWIRQIIEQMRDQVLIDRQASAAGIDI